MNSKAGEMATLSQVLETLRLRKQDNELKIFENGFKSSAGKLYQASELKIIRTYRFEGNSDPSDSSILYVIEANDGLIGYSIDAYGAYTNHGDDNYDEVIKDIRKEEKTDFDK